ncbi:BTB/POZ domain-containing protein 16 [Ambystoma mexicanum]|uniref:BTB/POZ domain-containing protein 16 n=1 Tax=Ambystoma mexicanum TaxID=8296 RepID=UPI0037E90B96
MPIASTAKRITTLEPNPENRPTAPPKPPRAVTLNALDVMRTPYVALTGGLTREEAEKAIAHIHKVPYGAKQRLVRSQVGLTNRWQIPCNLDFDLLGTHQARKAIRIGFNETLMPIMTERTHVARDAPLESSTRSPAATPRTPSRGPKTTIPAQCRYKSAPHGQKVMAVEKAFFYEAQKVTKGLEPDVVLHALGIVWEVHRPYLIKSDTLAHLLRLTMEHKRLEEGLQSTEKYSTADRLDESSSDVSKQKDTESSPKKMKQERVAIQLDVQDELVTIVGFSLALRNLYFSEVQVDQENVVGVLASAAVLQFQSLFQECVIMMKNTISPENIGKYHYAAQKYKQEALVQACEQWLEVNLVPVLGSQIYLRQLSQELLQKVLKSPRLFTFNEYRLLRAVVYWLFLQQNSKIQILPAHNTILSYFNSLPKRGAFLETKEGQRYTPIFQSLRLHGITESQQLEELKQINVLPQTWLVRVLANHHHALQNGGDMPLQTDFNTQAVRFGLIVDQERQFFAEFVARYGFIFELKIIRQEEAMYNFYMQRAKPTNPALSFHASERSAFSLRKDREVKYKITALSTIEGKWKELSLGPLIQKFGITNRNNKSKVLKAYLPNYPIYVTFAILFPPT